MTVGGMTPPMVLTFLDSFRGHAQLSRVVLVHIQEIIVEVGRFFDDNGNWILLAGKKAGEWRGTAVAFKSTFSHSSATVHQRACSVILTDDENTLGVLSGHIPHHATVDETQQILEDWRHSKAVNQRKLVVGMDANEVFHHSDNTPGFPKGNTARGDVILQWTAEHSRLDYLVVRNQVAAIAMQMTNPGRDMEKYKESPELKRVRREAQTTPPGPGRKAAWKRVQALANAEKKLWHTKLHEAASKRDWRAYRAHKQLLRTHEWEHYLLDDTNWQLALKTHFEGVFKKEATDSVARHLATKKDQLARLCKTTRWLPFTIEELQVTQEKWPRRKAAGPDGIVHEALFFLMQDDLWAHRILFILNDALYRGTAPRKRSHHPPTKNPNTRHMVRHETHNHFVLDAEVVGAVVTSAHTTPAGTTLQAPVVRQRAAISRNAAGHRKIARMGRDWGGPFIIVKLDVKKAFDTASQRSMGDLIADHIGAQGHPWEARVWLSLLHAKGMDVQFGGTNVFITQSNGVRQGGPDSPVVFSALIGDTLLKTAEKVTADPRGPDSRLPPPPHHTAGYMDDVYVWGENPRHVQEILTVLESIRRARSPVSFAGGPAFLTAELATRARKAFYGNKKTLCAKTKLASRIKAYNVIVREAALWGAPTWPIHDSLLRTANTTQLQHIRIMMDLRRRPGESWHEWNTRTLRAARVTLHKLEIPRWSTRVLEAIWNLWGHVGSAADTATRDILAWRGMQFWAEEQLKPSSIGARHAGRYNPNLDTERHITATAGNTRWWEVARDREHWQKLGMAFVEKHDVPWSSGRQPALNNLAPNRMGTPGGSRLPFGSSLHKWRSTRGATEAEAESAETPAREAEDQLMRYLKARAEHVPSNKPTAQVDIGEMLRGSSFFSVITKREGRWKWQLYTFEALQELGGYTHPLPQTSTASGGGAPPQSTQQEQTASSGNSQGQRGAQGHQDTAANAQQPAAEATPPQQEGGEEVPNQKDAAADEQQPKPREREATSTHSDERATAASGADPQPQTQAAQPQPQPQQPARAKAPPVQVLAAATAADPNAAAEAAGDESETSWPSEDRVDQPNPMNPGEADRTELWQRELRQARRPTPAKKKEKSSSEHQQKEEPNPDETAMMQHHQTSRSSFSTPSVQEARAAAARARRCLLRILELTQGEGPTSTASPLRPAATHHQRGHPSGSSRRGGEQQQRENPLRATPTMVWDATTTKLLEIAGATIVALNSEDVVQDLRQIQRLILEGSRQFHTARKARDWSAVRGGEDLTERASEVCSNLLGAINSAPPGHPPYVLDVLERMLYQIRSTSKPGASMEKKKEICKGRRHPPTTHHMRTTRNYLEAQSHSYLNQLTEPTTRPDKTSTTWTTKGDQQPAAEGGSTLMTQYDSSVKNGAASSSPPFTRPAGAYTYFIDTDVLVNSKGGLGGQGLVLCPQAWNPPPLLKITKVLTGTLKPSDLNHKFVTLCRPHGGGDCKDPFDCLLALCDPLLPKPLQRTQTPLRRSSLSTSTLDGGALHVPVRDSGKEGEIANFTLWWIWFLSWVGEMDLAYDEHSVDVLLEEAKDRWGNTPEAGGSEEEEEEPPDILQFWYSWGGNPPKSPHLDLETDDDDLDLSARKRLVPILSGDVERPLDNKPQ
ncbi:unnamed protein product [Symbiodinium sp. KB8]|nr:unnamed protein product [Symbiodinium sp. KB8]